jgi:hypothetical protein
MMLMMLMMDGIMRHCGMPCGHGMLSAVPFAL